MQKQVKSLGKMGSRLLLTLGSQDKTIFTVSEAQKILKTSYPATRTLLSRLEEKRWVARLRGGKYLIIPLSAGEDAEYSENWHIVAKHLIEPNPYYLSHYSALDIHGLTTQPIMTVFISASKRRQPIQVLGATFRFVYTQPSNIWGTEEVWAKPTEKVRVSDLERTFIDCLNNPKLCGGVSEAAKGMWAKRRDIDYSKLLDYVKRFGSKAVAKRLGFLLELYEISDEETSKQLKTFVSPSFVLLDPSLPAQGKYLNSWKLRINLNPEELKEIVKT